MFSNRTDWNLTPNDLARLVDEKRRAGASILDLTESNPTRCGFQYNPELLDALRSERSLHYEPDPRGLLSARTAVAEFYARNGAAVDPANIVLAASTSEAYAFLFRLFCNPGESVLVPKPSYPLFDYLCALNDVEPIHYRLAYDDEWHLEAESLRGAVDSATRAVVLVHPNNPTGSFVKEHELAPIVGIAGRRNLPLIVDEVFREYPIGGIDGMAGSFAGLRSGLVCTLGGISKLLGLPQMKLAWIVLSGDSAAVRNAKNRLEIIADTYLSVGTTIQHALPKLFQISGGMTDQIRRRVAANHAHLCRSVGDSSMTVLNVEGGWNAILRLPAIHSDEEWAVQLLKEGNVLVHPGHFFEIEQNSCVVLSLLPEPTVFSQGISRTSDVVRSVVAQTRST